MSASKVYIEPTEDIAITCAKISGASNKKVVVIVPGGANIISSLVSLKLLARTLLKSDKLVVFVTEDELGRKYADKAGLVSAKKLTDITTDTWEGVNTKKNSQIESADDKKKALIEEHSVAKVDSAPLLDQNPVVVVAETTNEATDQIQKEQADQEVQLEQVEQVEQLESEEPKTELQIDRNDDLPVLQSDPIEEQPLVADLPVETPVEEEVKPLFQKLEPKLVELGTYAILSGGDIMVDSQGEELKAKLNFLNVYHNNKLAEKHQVEIPQNGFQHRSPLTNIFSRVKTTVKQGSGRLKSWQEQRLSSQAEKPKPLRREVRQERTVNTPNLTNRNFAHQQVPTENIRTSRPIVADTVNNPSRFRLPSVSASKGRMMAVGGVLLFIFSLASVIIFPSAQIKVKVQQKSVSIEEKITAETGREEISADTLIIPMKQLGKSDSRSETHDATGTGQTGVKAKGYATFLNNDTAGTPAVSLPAGVVLTRGSLNYVTLSPISVDPGSSVETQIEAASFGEEYNKAVASNETLKIQNNPKATTLSAFTYKQITGGTKTDIKVVAQKDIDDVKNQLINVLRESIRTDIDALMSTTDIKLNQEVTYTEPKVTTTKAVGAEAENFDITVALSGSINIISKNDVTEVLKSILKNQGIDEAFIIQSISDPAVTDISFKDKQSTFTLAATAVVIPQFDVNVVKEKVLGMSTSQAESTLKGMENVESVQLQYSPGYVPGFLRVVPRDKSKVEVSVSK